MIWVAWGALAIGGIILAAAIIAANLNEPPDDE